MNYNSDSISADCSMSSPIETMEACNVNRLLVVEGGFLVGILRK